MKVFVYLFAAAMLTVVVQSCLDNRRAKNYNDQTLLDQGGILFVKKGIEGGMTEMKASAMAQTTSKNMRIVGFAKMMITDHTQAGDELTKIEADKNLDKIDTISAEHQQALSDLSKKSGADFDKAYMQLMVDDHTKTVELFKDATRNKSGAVVEFSRKTLPTIQMHLDSATAINASLK